MKILAKLKMWWARRRERYWEMDEAKAKSIAAAILYELGAVESGRFMDEWKRRRVERLRNTSPNNETIAEAITGKVQEMCGARCIAWADCGDKEFTHACLFAANHEGPHKFPCKPKEKLS